MKRCSCCKQEKEFSLFHKNRSGKFGYADYCIECKKENRNKHKKKRVRELKEKSLVKVKTKKFELTKNKWIVYELYDINRECIYVGQSKVFSKRIIQHAYSSSFYGEIKTIVCYIMESFPDMAFLEAQLIVELQPKYNVRILESTTSRFNVEYVQRLKYTIEGTLLD